MKRQMSYRVVTQIGERNSKTILRKIFVLHHKDIRHTGGTIKIVLFENAKMLQLQMTLTKIALLGTKREKIGHLMFLCMTGYVEI